MADVFDRASEAEERDRDAALAQAQASYDFNSDSLRECMDCGADIPEGRRKLQGVKRCIGCQQEFEND